MTAQLLGRRLARCAWNATVAGPRMLIVATVAAAIAHALAPAMAFGVYFLIFAAADLMTTPFSPMILRMSGRWAPWFTRRNK